MKNITLLLVILLIAFACKKIDNTPPAIPVVIEESIKFTTNLDTGSYNVIDTLPLIITVSSKLPQAGMTYSVCRQQDAFLRLYGLFLTYKKA